MGSQVMEQAPKKTELDKKFDAVFEAARKSLNVLRYQEFKGPTEGPRTEGTFQFLINWLNEYSSDSEKKKIRSNLPEKYNNVAEMIK